MQRATKRLQFLSLISLQPSLNHVVLFAHIVLNRELLSWANYKSFAAAIHIINQRPEWVSDFYRDRIAAILSLRLSRQSAGGRPAAVAVLFNSAEISMRSLARCYSGEAETRHWTDLGRVTNLSLIFHPHRERATEIDEANDFHRAHAMT